MTCTEFEELSGAYVLDAITPEEREEAEAHLAQCTNCTQLIQELRPVADLLPLAVPQIEPPPELKEQIFAAIHGQVPGTAQRIQSMPATTLQRRRQPRWQGWSIQLLAAAALLLFLLGGMGIWNISLQQQVAAAQQKITALTPVIYSLRGSSPTSNATGQLIYYPQQHITVLLMHGLPQLEGSHVYQGWLLHGKQPTSIGLLNIKNGVATVDFPGNVKGFDAAAVSLEPGPSQSLPGPKGSVVASGELNTPTSTT